MRFEYRKKQLNAVEQNDFDVVIVGGGISGAAIFHHLAKKGYRVLLVDKGDFASGTSQSSAMMAWGNLPDLRKLSLIKVRQISALRDRLIKDRGEWVFPRSFRYLSSSDCGRKPFSAAAALYTYWLFSAGQRSKPHYQKDFSERDFLANEKFSYSYEYEEASLEPSDARFVLGWILEQQNCSGQIALNYCSLKDGKFNSTDKNWHLEIIDSILEKEIVVKAKCVVNAAGVWTDRLNQEFSIQSPYKHALGKGVFIGINRPENHQMTLMIETKDAEGCLALIPWGPISLWGPTETRINNPEDGFSVDAEDVSFLIKQLNRHLSEPVLSKNIVSLRCGVRPLPIKVSDSEAGNTFAIPREYKVYADKSVPWISIYGGKITSCVSAAKWVDSLLQKFGLSPRSTSSAAPTFDALSPKLEEFPNLIEKVPSAQWSAEKEMCWNLEDYLRRRTNISQWIARGGLGLQNENLLHLTDLARIFSENDEGKAHATIDSYQQKIRREFDEVLANIG
ncbi:MAG TPA: FAD-dependent oxidoreductase [Pyrinomonadaceae bacterium]|nr:FAD-dependent oxidoreductase [Pyrinomonadaceae bacterium]